MSPLMLFGLAASSAAVMVATWLMLRDEGAKDQLEGRIAVARDRWAERRAAEDAGRRSAREPLQRAVSRIGAALIGSGLISGAMKRQLQQTLLASGFRGPAAMPVFLGAKLVLVLAVPALAWVISGAAGWGSTNRMLLLGIGVITGLLAPDYVVRRLRKGYLGRLDNGLPDGLDLLVICVQAGLSLEPALARVAAELRLAQKEVAQEIEATIREIEVLADTRLALTNLATRIELPTVKRLVSTLLQTMQYGTPLTEALRSLSAEVRQQALTRFETRAARLPVLLTLPMILFILPCVFIIVGGPAVIQVIRSVHH